MISQAIDLKREKTAFGTRVQVFIDGGRIGSYGHQPNGDIYVCFAYSERGTAQNELEAYNQLIDAWQCQVPSSAIAA
ncbi:MAG: hypothetical protein AAF327_14025 [Cyanobacteria bacterium P01_A01_bin.37]